MCLKTDWDQRGNHNHEISVFAQFTEDKNIITEPSFLLLIYRTSYSIAPKKNIATPPTNAITTGVLKLVSTFTLPLFAVVVEVEELCAAVISPVATAVPLDVVFAVPALLLALAVWPVPDAVATNEVQSESAELKSEM
jgi:hypothetical protein